MKTINTRVAYSILFLLSAFLIGCSTPPKAIKRDSMSSYRKPADLKASHSADFQLISKKTKKSNLLGGLFKTSNFEARIYDYKELTQGKNACKKGGLLTSSTYTVPSKAKLGKLVVKKVTAKVGENYIEVSDQVKLPVTPILIIADNDSQRDGSSRSSLVFNPIAGVSYKLIYHDKPLSKSGVSIHLARQVGKKEIPVPDSVIIRRGFHYFDFCWKEFGNY